MPRLSVKPVIYKKGKKDHQEATIAIRVTYLGQSRFQETNYRSIISWFDEKTGKVSSEHPNHALANNSIDRQRSKIEYDLFLMREHEDFNLETIENYLDRKATTLKRSFTSFVKHYCLQQANLFEKTNGIEGRSPGTIRNYEKCLEKLHRFAGKDDVKFKDITPKFLEAYKLWMLDDKKPKPGEKRNRGHKKNSYTTVWDSLTKFIVKFFNAAEVPLPKFEWPSAQEANVQYLTLEEIRAIEKILPDLSGLEYQDALYFLLECYSGVRHSDWNRFSLEKLLDGDNFKVRAKKNGEPIYLSLKNRPRLAATLQLVKQTPYNGILETTNINLKIVAAKAGITKRVSTHVGRHTCAVLHAERGFSKEYVAELLGIGMRTVEKYYKTTRQKLRREDERLEGL